MRCILPRRPGQDMPPARQLLPLEGSLHALLFINSTSSPCPHRGDTAPTALSPQIALGRGGRPRAASRDRRAQHRQLLPAQPGASIPQPASLWPHEKPQFSCLSAEYLTPSPAQRGLSASCCWGGSGHRELPLQRRVTEPHPAHIPNKTRLSWGGRQRTYPGQVAASGDRGLQVCQTCGWDGPPRAPSLAQVNGMVKLELQRF